MQPDPTSTSGAPTLEAPAKLNLTLRVLGRRPDGYHDLESVVATLDWGDRLAFRPADGLTLVSRGLPVPAGEENLIVRAAQALERACGPQRGARIDLEKRIPPGRGLGGGSSDAAATLAGLNALWELGLEAEELARIGAEIGSDVPVFFAGPVAVMRGRGERIEPVGARLPWWALVAWPDRGNPTARVYEAFDAGGGEAGEGPAATEILSAVASSAEDAARYLVNDLERAAAGVRLNNLDLRRILEQSGARAVGMTGSGSAYFALADTEAQARAWADAAKAASIETRVARFARE
jgi:4-diphosphocytidyl-2-C-methyl-D-erythritol kinase